MSTMPSVIGNGITGKKAAHIGGQSAWPAPQKDMGMLCEVLDYVKLNCILSLLFLIFLPLFTNLLHIIVALWQAH